MEAVFQATQSVCLIWLGGEPVWREHAQSQSKFVVMKYGPN